MALQLEGCIEEPGVCWVLKYGEDFDGLGQNVGIMMGVGTGWNSGY